MIEEFYEKKKQNCFKKGARIAPNEALENPEKGGHKTKPKTRGAIYAGKQNTVRIRGVGGSYRTARQQKARKQTAR